MIVKLTDKILLVGTSHISKKSVQEITKAFDKHEPTTVALELDVQRLHSLLSPGNKRIPLKLIKQVGVTGFLFLTIGQYVQKKLAGTVGVEPGLEMRHAYALAAEQKKKLLLIDQPILVTMKNVKKKFTFREKFRLFFDVLLSPFQKERLKINLEEVPGEDVLLKIITELKDRYPGLYHALIHDRDKYMVRALTNYSLQHPDEIVVAVVGAGHVQGMLSLMKK